jgi:dihydromonapterin reductase/dihydrofolate reductase
MPSSVLITGVGKRVGYQLAQNFLKHDVPVIGTYRTHYDSIDNLNVLGGDLYQVDFYNPESLAGFLDQVTAKYSSLRAIIHNASDWLSESHSSSEDDIFQKMMRIHAEVPYRINLELKALLVGQAKATDIIHITDYVAETGSKKHIAYAASKAALENLTRSFAALYAPEVKVNSIAPALICFNETDTEAYKVKTLEKALIPREGGYESVIEAVDYLMVSDYVTGRSFALDGGRHLK